MTSARRAVVGTGLVLALVACVGGCSSRSGSKHGSPVTVVAATNVWGDVVRVVGGNRVQVTSIITDPAADPHTYEANARTELAVSRAQVVIENGGGYDDFMQRMLAAAGGHRTVVNVVSLSGKTAPPGGDLNEHVWYDFPTVEKFATALAADLTKADPDGKSEFLANAAHFDSQLHTLEADEAQIKSAHAGNGVAITEPVPLYMLQACGLVNQTPPQFSRAIEDGTGVPAAVLAQTLALFSAHRVKLLAYNEQTSGPETARVLAAAKAHGIPVVPVTETLPPGKAYLSWMTDNLTAIKQALH
jgi:zinc/manganese transport system substrate-binding protein